MTEQEKKASRELADRLEEAGYIADVDANDAREIQVKRNEWKKLAPSVEDTTSSVSRFHPTNSADNFRVYLTIRQDDNEMCMHFRANSRPVVLLNTDKATRSGFNIRNVTQAFNLTDQDRQWAVKNRFYRGIPAVALLKRIPDIVFNVDDIDEGFKQLHILLEQVEKLVQIAHQLYTMHKQGELPYSDFLLKVIDRKKASDRYNRFKKRNVMGNGWYEKQGLYWADEIGWVDEKTGKVVYPYDEEEHIRLKKYVRSRLR